uniref:Uncharacterized protein n=1 Tax=Dictyomenia sonderi TaxID=2007178 RepID=A0A1Z1MSL8_9FLOR|nr:hypothetical protein [Dictyomenia sonderi]ARW69097.1 hypothetical protein [Dictyomenia sonderi]
MYLTVKYFIFHNKHNTSALAFYCVSINRLFCLIIFFIT